MPRADQANYHKFQRDAGSVLKHEYHVVCHWLHSIQRRHSPPQKDAPPLPWTQMRWLRELQHAQLSLDRRPEVRAKRRAQCGGSVPVRMSTLLREIQLAQAGAPGWGGWGDEDILLRAQIYFQLDMRGKRARRSAKVGSYAPAEGGGVGLPLA